jgi:hypothetical protein
VRRLAAGMLVVALLAVGRLMVALEGLASAPPSLGPPSRADLVHPAQLEECYWAVLAEAAAVVDLMSRPLAYLRHWARLAVGRLSVGGLLVPFEGLVSAPTTLLIPLSRADLVTPAAQLEECYWAVLAEAAAVVDMLSRPFRYLAHWARLAVPAAAAMNWHSSRFRHRLTDWGLAFLEKPFLKLCRCSCAKEFCVVDDEGFGEKFRKLGLFVCLVTCSLHP